MLGDPLFKSLREGRVLEEVAADLRYDLSSLASLLSSRSLVLASMGCGGSSGPQRWRGQPRECKLVKMNVFKVMRARAEQQCGSVAIDRQRLVSRRL